MPNAAVDLITKILDVRNAADNLMEALHKRNIEETHKAYAGAMVDMYEASSKVASEWMEGDFRDEASVILLENSTLRTLVGPLCLAHGALLEAHKEINKRAQEQGIEPLTPADIMILSLTSSTQALTLSLSGVLDFDNRLPPLTQNQKLCRLLQDQAPATLAELVKRYGAQPQASQRPNPPSPF